jgi:hypothetical protein
MMLRAWSPTPRWAERRSCSPKLRRGNAGEMRFGRTRAVDGEPVVAGGTRRDRRACERRRVLVAAALRAAIGHDCGAAQTNCWGRGGVRRPGSPTAPPRGAILTVGDAAVLFSVIVRGRSLGWLARPARGLGRTPAVSERRAPGSGCYRSMRIFSVSARAPAQKGSASGASLKA